MNDTNIQTYLGKFEIVECYKKDSVSAVYLANHIYLGKQIILKTLDSSTLEDKAIMERFNREAKILAKLDHPNIIKVLDFGFYESVFYLSFEYYEGGTLRDIIQKATLSFQQKKNLLIQLFNALDYAHNHQVIHRDIKPENILVDETLHLKIADFGLALGLNDNNVTCQYSIVGTPGYMSPEQIRGEKLTNKSDLFSAGIIAYELFNGNNPFIGQDVSQTINNILQYDEKIIEESISSLDEAVKKVISGLLQKNSDKRIKSSSEVLSLLGYDKPNEPKTEITFKKKNRSAKYYAAAGSIIILSLLIWFFVVEKSNSIKTNQSDTAFNKPETVQQQTPVTNFNKKEETKKETLPIKENEKPQPGIKEKKEDRQNPEVVTGWGKIFIECSPWADIYFDSSRKETTPLKDYISLPAGTHNITLKHPDYPEYSFNVEVKKDQNLYLKYNLSTLFGYLDCKIYPWGEIYIDGKFKGSTPLQNYIALKKGEHRITVKNPSYNDYQTTIFIEKSEVKEFKFNFNSNIKDEKK